jgi:hypothetical protein
LQKLVKNLNTLKTGSAAAVGIATKAARIGQKTIPRLTGNIDDLKNFRYIGEESGHKFFVPESSLTNSINEIKNLGGKFVRYEFDNMHGHHLHFERFVEKAGKIKIEAFDKINNNWASKSSIRKVGGDWHFYPGDKIPDEFLSTLTVKIYSQPNYKQTSIEEGISNLNKGVPADWIIDFSVTEGPICQITPSSFNSYDDYKRYCSMCSSHCEAPIA